MIKYKLINILKLLNSQEWSSLRKYMLMYTRIGSDNYNLFDVLRQNISKINENKDVLALHDKHFTQMSSKSFTNMFSRVTGWTEDWIVYQEIKKDEHTSNGILLNFYNRKGLYKEANNTALKAEKSLVGEKKESLKKYKHLSHLWHSQYYSNNPIKYKNGIELFQKTIDAKLTDFGNQLAAYKIEMQNWAEIKDHSFATSINDLNEIISYVKENQTLTSLHSISEVFTTRQPDNLHIILNNLQNGLYKENEELELLIASYLTALTLRLWGENKLDDYNIIQEAYEYSLASGILLSSGKIPLIRWYNILSVMSTVFGEIKSMQFLERWINKVTTNDLFKTKQLSQSLINFHTGNYNKIYSTLKNIKYSKNSEKFRANQLIAISLYMNKEELYSEFIEHCNNSLRLLKRNKKHLDTNTYLQFRNLIIILLDLTKSKYQNKSYLIEIPNKVMHKQWLSEEIKRVNEKISSTL